MTANPHLTAQLDDFADLKSPGFALMITAPWGAGKTHAVRKWLGDRNHLYVSLFGIDSLAGVEEALFEAAFVGRQGAKLAMNPTKAVSGLAKGLEGLLEKATGVSFDASGLVRKAVLADAPSLLVFDDLERAQLDPPRLLSIINRFVEHEGKTVLLLANEDELERAKGQPDSGEAKSDYRRWREKVVGRTITLRPDTQAALDSFFAAIVDEGARTALANRREAILDVFARSETANLRLLRQSLIECGRFLTRVPEAYRRQERALTSLIADYLALSIDWHAGERLSVGDFNPYELTARRFERQNDPSVPIPGLDRLRARHETSPFSDLYERYLPLELAFKPIVEGYAPDEEVSHFLRRAGGFLQEVQEGALETLEWWPERDERAVEAAYLSVRQHIADLSIVDPPEVRRVWDAMLFLSNERLFGLRSENVVAEAVEYIERLARENRLPVPGGNEVIEQWSSGRTRETTEQTQIREAVRAALELTRKRDTSQRLRDLLDDLRNEPYRFSVALKEGDQAKGIPDLHGEPIFHVADAATVADEVFALPPHRWRRFLGRMKRRQEDLDFYAGQGAGPPNHERQWLLDFRDHALEVAEASSPIRRAQILMAVNHHLAFLDTPPEPPNS